MNGTRESRCRNAACIFACLPVFTCFCGFLFFRKGGIPCPLLFSGLGGGVFLIILFNGKISKNTLFFNRHGMPTTIVSGCLVALLHARYFDGLSAAWPEVVLKNPDILTEFPALFVSFVSWILFACAVGIVAFAFGRIVGIMPSPKPPREPTDDS